MTTDPTTPTPAIAEGEPLRERALRLYQGPFRYEQGYIWDAKGEMVADNHIEPALRIRGWGRIGYMPDGEKLQDEVGKLAAEALTKFWEEARRPSPEGRREVLEEYERGWYDAILRAAKWLGESAERWKKLALDKGSARAVEIADRLADVTRNVAAMAGEGHERALQATPARTGEGPLTAEEVNQIVDLMGSADEVTDELWAEGRRLVAALGVDSMSARTAVVAILAYQRVRGSLRTGEREAARDDVLDRAVALGEEVRALALRTEAATRVAALVDALRACEGQMARYPGTSRAAGISDCIAAIRALLAAPPAPDDDGMARLLRCESEDEAGQCPRPASVRSHGMLVCAECYDIHRGDGRLPCHRCPDLTAPAPESAPLATSEPDALEPCPWCKRPGTFHGSEEDGWCAGCWFDDCIMADCATPYFPTREEAAECWNAGARRPVSERTRALLDAIGECMTEYSEDGEAAKCMARIERLIDEPAAPESAAALEVERERGR